MVVPGQSRCEKGGRRTLAVGGLRADAGCRRGGWRTQRRASGRRRRVVAGGAAVTGEGAMASRRVGEVAGAGAVQQGQGVQTDGLAAAGVVRRLGCRSGGAGAERQLAERR
ncbi:hypothetical protein ACJRO7_019906 [Eucalyptus globulus]|uniref:Uncharacterized protein n=1 Tax=Eucalyptus globulus TaxID=34317 RepID=A0ABD3KLK1_EUCGL